MGPRPDNLVDYGYLWPFTWLLICTEKGPRQNKAKEEPYEGTEYSFPRLAPATSNINIGTSTLILE